MSPVILCMKNLITPGDSDDFCAWKTCLLSFGLFITPKCVKSQNQLPFHNMKNLFVELKWTLSSSLLRSALSSTKALEGKPSPKKFTCNSKLKKGEVFLTWLSIRPVFGVTINWGEVELKRLWCLLGSWFDRMKRQALAGHLSDISFSVQGGMMVVLFQSWFMNWVLNVLHSHVFWIRFTYVASVYLKYCENKIQLKSVGFDVSLCPKQGSVFCTPAGAGEQQVLSAALQAFVRNERSELFAGTGLWDFWQWNLWSVGL